MEQKIQDFRLQKKRIIDVYTVGDMDRLEYVTKCLTNDNEVSALNKQRMELIRRVPLLHKPKVIDASILQYCQSARIQYQQSNDFSSKREFLVNYIEQITYWNDRIAVHGSVPIRIDQQNTNTESGESETSKLEFIITTKWELLFV